MTPTTICQRCGVEQRKPKERFCAKCGKAARLEARCRAWAETPDVRTTTNEARGRKYLPVDNSPRYQKDEE